MLFADDGKRIAPVPRRVAILGMGPTLQDFIHLRLQQPGGVVDEVWGMNNVCAAVKCDVGFIMDDFVEMLEQPHKDAVFWDKSNPDLMRWCRDECTIPLITSKAYRPRYRTSCAFPLDTVYRSVFQDHLGFHFSNTTSYAIAMAWHLGVREIHLYGCDFAYPWHDPYDRRKFLEASRANVEALLLAGYMLGKFTFHLSARTSLFDTMYKRPFYGYADGRHAMPDSLITDKSKETMDNDQRIIPPGQPNYAPGKGPVAPQADAVPVKANGHDPDGRLDLGAPAAGAGVQAADAATPGGHKGKQRIPRSGGRAPGSSP